MQRPTEFVCVPFNNNWTTNQKLDLKAIYRRPVLDEWTREQKIDPKTDLPLWDLTGPLPVRRHADYMRKGFEYVTLADVESLRAASVAGTLPVESHIRDYVMNARTGPWDDQFYLSTQARVDGGRMDALKQLVNEFGSEAIERSRQLTEPAFRLPVNLRGLKPGEVAAKARVAREPSTVTASAGATTVVEQTAPSQAPPQGSEPEVQSRKRA